MWHALFDLTGPAFLAFYAAAFVLALWLGRRTKAQLLVPADAGPASPARLSVYEMACLAGGKERVIATALARMAHLGWLTQATQGSGCSVQLPLPPHAHEVERFLYREIEREPGQPFSALSRLDGGALQSMESSLRGQGWLVDPDAPRTAWVRRLAALPLQVLMVIGLLKVGVGLSRDKPVFFLLIFLAISMLVWRSTHAKLPRLTPRADAFLLDLNRRNAALETTVRRSEHVAHDDLILAVALFGTAVLANGAWGWLDPRANSSGSSGGSGGDASGGGGGDGGGGGGCGGCGGGGGGCS
jgi:uncharacterized protein (TIGR04222 family)